MDEKTKAEIAEFFEKNDGVNIPLVVAVLLAVLKAGQIDNPGIIKKLIDEYLDPDFIDSKDYEIKSGGTALSRRCTYRESYRGFAFSY